MLAAWRGSTMAVTRAKYRPAFTTTNASARARRRRRAAPRATRAVVVRERVRKAPVASLARILIAKPLSTFAEYALGRARSRKCRLPGPRLDDQASGSNLISLTRRSSTRFRTGACDSA